MGLDVRENLMNEIMFLETLQTRVLIPMLEEISRSADNLKVLAREQKDLTKRIQNVIVVAQNAQDNLKSKNAVQEVKFSFSENCFSVKCLLFIYIRILLLVVVERFSSTICNGICGSC